MEEEGDAQQSARLITIQCKYGKDSLPVSISPHATVHDLKEKLQHLTNVLPRGQKLISKGKVLDSNISLKGACLADGSKVMIIASQDVHQGSAAVVKKDLIPSKVVGAPRMPLPLKSLTKTRVDTWRATGIISLRDSALQAVPSEIWSIGLSARILDVGGNCLQDFPGEVCSLGNLQKLRLSANGFIDGQIQWRGLTTLNHLTVLALDHNLLTHVPSEVGLLCSLKHLSAAHNNLENVAEEVGNLLNLEKLQLSHNRLTTLPSSLGQCCHLIEIDLSANLLREVPSSLGDLRSLKVLDLGNNALKSFPDKILRGCVELSTLSLHGNELTIDNLREMDGWPDFDKRRKSKYSKQIDFNILGSSGGFDEGADAQQWHHW